MPAEDTATKIPQEMLDKKVSEEKIKALFNPQHELKRLEAEDVLRASRAEQRYRLLLSLPDNQELEFNPVPGEGGIYRVQRGDLVEFFVLDEKNQILEHDLQELIADLPNNAWVLSKEARKKAIEESKDEVLEVLAPYLTEPQKLLMLNDIGVYVLPEEHFKVFERGMGSKRSAEGVFRTNSYRKYNPELGGVRVFSFSGRRLIVAKEANSEISQPLYMPDTEYAAECLAEVMRHEYLHALGVGTVLPEALEEAAVEYYAQLCGEYRQVDVRVAYPLATRYFGRLAEIAEEGGFGAQKFHTAIIGKEDGDLASVKEFFQTRYGEDISNRILNYGFNDAVEANEFLDYQEAMLKKRSSLSS